MALNLWKAAGKPTAYNPLVSLQSISIPLYKSYIVTFKAKSDKNAVLRVHSYHNFNDLNQEISLSADLTRYSFEWYESRDGTLVIFDKNNVGDIIITDIELVEKPLPLRRTPKTPAKPVAKQEGGLRMDGMSNYLQLPSMTMDSIEIDCLIDSVQFKSINTIVDARYGLSNGYLQINSERMFFSSGWSYANGYKFGERSVIILKASVPFTDDVTVFNNMFNSQQTKGILYAVRCYLNGAKVYELDFTNPNSVVGDKVLQQSNNLIPSFEDSRWQLHTNARVYGKDVLRLEATANHQQSRIEIPANPNKDYVFVTSDKEKYVLLYLKEDGSNVTAASGNPVHGSAIQSGQAIKTPNTDTFKKFAIMNLNYSTGTFDFIKPQLYELSGSEGTVYGAPTRGLKPAKRTLYNRR